jgi:RHS repeat-associated protein
MVWLNSPELVHNLRFPGQYYQAATALRYNYFRDYGPQVGSFIDSDPIGLRGGSYSTYVYGADDSEMIIDRKGLVTSPLAITGPSLGPIPIFPDTSDSAKCRYECTKTAKAGAEQCRYE